MDWRQELVDRFRRQAGRLDDGIKLMREGVFRTFEVRPSGEKIDTTEQTIARDERDAAELRTIADQVEKDEKPGP